MQPRFIARGLAIFSLMGMALGAYGWWSTVHPAVAASTSAPPPIIQAVGGLPDFSAIVQAYGPAVVNITSTSEGSHEQGNSFGIDPNDPMYEFFRRFGMPMMPRDDGPHRAQGSGFIVNADGVILTNAHVVDDASEVTVKLTDKREFRAKVIGIDKPSDVAVLKISAKNLPVVRVGNAGAVNVGEWVLAIGSPFGFENSVTAGIVSAKSRSLPDENYVPFIQTDVAVNPGNSGGPLFNMHGEVIGINSQIYTHSGGYQGLSFAIPIDVAMKVESQILQHGKVVRGRMGAAIQDLNQDLAESFGLSSPKGALVNSVEPDSPAERAGLKPGDVVLALNGQTINSSADLPPKVADLKPGSEAALDVWRDHRTQRMTVKIGEIKAKSAAFAVGDNDQGRLGLSVRPLSQEEKQQLHVAGGLVVAEASGPAARAGVQPGDVILAANGTTIGSVEQLRRLAKTASSRHLALLIQRNDEKLFIPINLG